MIGSNLGAKHAELQGAKWIRPVFLRIIELGYRFRKIFWGKGYATEGSLALIEKGFKTLGVEEIFAVTMKKNLASRRVMEKVGLQYLKEFEDPDCPGTTEMDVEYSLSRKNWLHFFPSPDPAARNASSHPFP